MWVFDPRLGRCRAGTRFGGRGGRASLGPVEQSRLWAWSSEGSMNLRYRFGSHEYMTNIRLCPLRSLIRDGLPGLHTLLLILSLALFSPPGLPLLSPTTPDFSSDASPYTPLQFLSSPPPAGSVSFQLSLGPTGFSQVQLPAHSGTFFNSVFHRARLCLPPGVHNPGVRAVGGGVPCSVDVPLTSGRGEPVDTFMFFSPPLNPEGYLKTGFI